MPLRLQPPCLDIHRLSNMLKRLILALCLLGISAMAAAGGNDKKTYTEWTNLPHDRPCLEGRNAVSLHRPLAAVRFFTACLQLPLSKLGRIHVLQERADAYAAGKRFIPALADLKEALQLSSYRVPFGAVISADSYRRRNQDIVALAILEDAVKMAEFQKNGLWSFGLDSAYSGIAEISLEADDYSKALGACDKAISLQKDQPRGKTYLLRGLIHESSGDRDAALQDMAKAAELAPEEGYDEAAVLKLKEYGFEVHVAPKE